MSRVMVTIFLFASILFAQNVDAALLRHFDGNFTSRTVLVRAVAPPA